MSRVQRGDVVLVPFPHTSLRSTAVRPTVVVSTSAHIAATGNMIVAMITSQPKNGPMDHEVEHWKEANLLRPSWIRAKLATLDPSMIRFIPGALSRRDIQGMDTILSLALGFSS